jgi:hypothetical protein
LSFLSGEGDRDGAGVVWVEDTVRARFLAIEKRWEAEIGWYEVVDVGTKQRWVGLKKLRTAVLFMQPSTKEIENKNVGR